MLESCCRTTMVVMVDDTRMSDQLAEFLLQVQGGLSQGLLKGTNAPKGSMMLTSNVKEPDRWHNIHTFTYHNQLQIAICMH